MSARALYEEAATHCHAVKDYVSRDLFEKLMHDEEEHIDFLETQLDLVAKLGAELYAQHHIGKLDDDKRLTRPIRIRVSARASICVNKSATIAAVTARFCGVLPMSRAARINSRHRQKANNHG